MNRLLLTLIVFHATCIIAADAPTKRVRLNEFYTVIPMSTSPQMDSANWIVADQEQGNSSVDSAVELLANFKSQPAKNKKNGIFVYSITHSFELTEKEKTRAAPRLIEMLNDKVWREAENKLVSELVTAANTEGIPVWTLLRGTGEFHTYKLLTDPKLTLKK